MNVSDEKRVLKAVERLEKQWAEEDKKAKNKKPMKKITIKKKDQTPIQIKTEKKKVAEVERKKVESIAEAKAKEAEKKRLTDNQAKIDADKD